MLWVTPFLKGILRKEYLF